MWGPGHTHLYLEGRQGVRQMFPETQGPGVSTQALTNQTVWAYIRNWPFFHKKPENRHVWLCKPHGFSSSYSTLPLRWESSHRAKENK